MRALAWLLRLAVFFALFAFALNNQQEVAVHWFFGLAWHAPMVIVVLAAFAAGCAIGVLAMLPSWWRHRREAQRGGAARDIEVPIAAHSSTNAPAVPSQFGAEAAVPQPRENW